MSVPKVECVDAVGIPEGKITMAQEDSSGTGRIRKCKKPEIQIYRPGALRQKRFSASNDQPVQGVHEPNVTKPEFSKKDVKDNVQRQDSANKTSSKARQRSSQEKEKEERVGDKALKCKNVDKSYRKGRELYIEVNADSSKEYRGDNQSSKETHIHEHHMSDKEKSGFLSHKEQQKLASVTEVRRLNEQQISDKNISALKKVGSDSQKDVKYIQNVRNDSQKNIKEMFEKPTKKQETKSSAEKNVSNFPDILSKKENITLSDTAKIEKSEKELNWKLRENNAKVGPEKHLSRKNYNAPEKTSHKKDVRRSSEGSSDIKASPFDYDKSVGDKAQGEVAGSHLNKKYYFDHNERSRDKSAVWMRENEDAKEGENNSHKRTAERGNKTVYDRPPSNRDGISELDNSKVKTDTWCNKNVDNRMSFKSRENEGKTGVAKQHNKERTQTGTYKNDRIYGGNYDCQYSKKETHKGKKSSYSKNEHINKEFDSSALKSPTKLDSGYCQSGEKYQNKDESKVSELAAKVDELAIGKMPRKMGSARRKGRGWHNSLTDGKDLQGGFTKGTQIEDKYSTVNLEPDKTQIGSKTESMCTISNVATPEISEKSPKVKSYSNVREHRRNRGNKSLNQGITHCNRREELKIEANVNKNSHERTVHVRQISESDTEEFENRLQTAQGVFSKNQDEVPSFSQKQSFSQKLKSGGYGKTAGVIHVPEEKCNPGAFDMEQEEADPMTFIDVPDDDWIDEVDRDMTWCNQHVGGTRLPTWEDEKSSWKSRRDKPHSESEDQQRRVESPSRRGGLIQLSATVPGTDFSGPEPAVSPQMTASLPQLQKHLYNPNNPSKPVLVVPSSRDLPAPRDPHREGSRGFGDNSSGSLLMESSQVSEYAIEGRSPKIDPSLIYNIQKGEMDINYYVSSNQLPVEFRRIMDIRHHLQGCYKQLLTSDIRMCQEKNVEGSLWKTLYYVIIEKLREYISRDPTLKDRSLSTLLMLVDEGQRYLQDLLEALQREYGFTLEDHLEDEGTSNTEIRGRVRMALMSAQKLLLSLGDLARYREQYSSTPNFSLAKKWYHMALQVHPRNGRPFNQLAIIAVNQKRLLDVVYYYIRSLTASNPFMSARDSLVSMFDDIRKKYVSAQNNEPHPEGMRTHMGRAHSGEGLRQEIWIRPDSGATHRRTLSHSTDGDGNDEENELKKLPLEQLMKRFLTSYLHCHGMLFSRVGLDGFRECCVMMLQEFSVLLRSSPPRLSTNHLLQIMAINMYAVSNTELKDARVGSGYRSAAQELALLLALEMFGRLVQLVVELLPHHIHQQQHSQDLSQPPAPVDPQRLFSPTLAYFMPPLKAWCDWLLYHSCVWNPPPAAHEYCTQSGGEKTWSSVAELATVLRGFGTPDVTLTEVATVGSGGGGGGSSGVAADMVPLKLSEDAFLRGYEPLLPAHGTITYVAPDAHTGRACDWARVVRLQLCLCQFMCGVDPPVLRLQKTDHGDILVSIVDTSPPDTPTAARMSLSISDVEVEDSMSESEDSEVEEEVEVETMEEDTPLASTVRLLTLRKKALEKKQRQQRKLQSLLEGSVTLEMEVRPRYLVPDTNCFIEHLDVVQALVNSAPYTVMVPLVVLNELDGLSRDAAVAKYGSVGHAVRVREGAAAALHYLRDTKPHSLKCVTSQGSVLSSTTFTAEIDMPDATNDDKILSCCVHFCSDNTQRRPIKTGVRRLYREVVLLTEDRNLRVKAHARDVPVRDLLDFAHWAGVR